MKLTLQTLFLLATTLLLTYSCKDSELRGSSSSSTCIDTNCADYSSRLDAQADFNWDPICRGDLDADNDGIACEENQWIDYYDSLNNNTGGGTGGSGNCPTTANCGCSNKPKSQCESDRCCRWIVGTGCKCD